MTKKIKFLNRNRSGEILTPIGIVIHETATPGATAENEYNYFNSGNRVASAHGFVDWDGYIQTIPYDEVAWHAGYTANHKYIGIELCHAKTKPEFGKVWTNAIEVVSGIMKRFKFTVSDLTTHNDVSKKWNETDHTDPIGYFAKFGKTFEDFKNEVENRLNGGLTMTQYEELKNEISKIQTKLEKINTFEYNYMDKNMPAWAKPAVQKLIDKGFLAGDDGGLGLTFDMLRIITVLDRAGAFER